MKRISGFSLAAMMALGGAPAALAQDAAAEPNVRQDVVYGTDECGSSTDDEIVVCMRLPEGERFRIPDILRGDPNAPVNEAWANKIQRIERVGRFGTDSCSPAGLGGFTGCTQQMINNAVAERQQDDRVNWTAAIAAERQKRIDAIDGKSREAEAAVVAQEAARGTRETEMAATRARLGAEEAARAEAARKAAEEAAKKSNPN